MCVKFCNFEAFEKWDSIWGFCDCASTWLARKRQVTTFCDLIFATTSLLAKFAKVKYTQKNCWTTIASFCVGSINYMVKFAIQAQARTLLYIVCSFFTSFHMFGHKKNRLLLFLLKNGAAIAAQAVALPTPMLYWCQLTVMVFILWQSAGMPKVWMSTKSWLGLFVSQGHRHWPDKSWVKIEGGGKN